MTTRADSVPSRSSPANAAVPSDAHLMRRLAGGDTSALGDLVRRHQQAAWSLAYRVTGRSDLADDATQDAFLRVWRSASSYQPTAAFSTWLYRIVTNLCLDHLRRPRLARMPENPPENPSPAADAALRQAERVQAIRREIAALPERQRVAVVLHRFHEQTHVQIAQVLECSIPAVESLLVRAYAQLRQQLKDWTES